MKQHQRADERDRVKRQINIKKCIILEHFVFVYTEDMCCIISVKL